MFSPSKGALAFAKHSLPPDRPEYAGLPVADGHYDDGSLPVFRTRSLTWGWGSFLEASLCG